MALEGAGGPSLRLIVQPDAGFSSLVSQLSTGETVRGRISEVLADGRAVVNLKGFSVTAELRGVTLARGESISVLVQSLKGTPVLRLLEAPAGNPGAAPAAVAPREGGDPVLGRLGLPQDSFHSTIVRLLGEYGLEVSRGAVMDIKETIVSGVAGARMPRSAQAIETAVFMRANGIAPNGEMARAVHEYLFGDTRIGAVLTRLEEKAAAVTGLSPALKASLDRALSVARAARVDPAMERVPQQIKASVEGMGLEHEALLAKAAAGAGAVEKTRESVKAALLELLGRMGETGESSAALGSLRDAAEEAVRLIQSQQVGAISQRNSAVVYVQVPVVMGEELHGGEIQVAWRRDREGGKRDPRKAAHMTLTLDTRSLGPVTVHMRVLGQGVSLEFNVADSEARAFINGELPDLVRRLTGHRLRMNQLTCEIAGSDEDEPVPQALPPTASFDMKA